ncbi:hypothetical protein lpymt_01974 [Legionella pneumophila]|nr:hypothetical protein lpymt_01974 [Legionella pneumophila]
MKKLIAFLLVSIAFSTKAQHIDLNRAIVKCCVWDKLFIKRRPVLIAH